jgi:hypothetical protein
MNNYTRAGMNSVLSSPKHRGSTPLYHGKEAGLVIRRPNPTDRRVNVLTVTTRGRQVRECLPARLFEPPEAFRKLPAQDQVKFRDAMLGAVGRQPRQRLEVRTTRRAG